MKANKDKGTSVGFSSDFILSGQGNLPTAAATNSAIQIDFKIKENLELINKQEWEDIFRQYKKWVCRNNFNLLPVWLEDNYLAPEKK